MKSFLKTFLASTLAVIAGISIMVFIGFVIVMGIAASTMDGDKEVKVKSHSVLVFDANFPIQDYNVEQRMLISSDLEKLLEGPKPDLPTILKTLRKASSDDRIKGMFLNIDPTFTSGFSNLKEVHDAMLEFRDSGKYIVAYSTFLTEGGYYLASAADRIVLNPSGEMLFNGLQTEIMFFKDALEKLGIEMQPFKVGKFKSAVEPYLQNEMSPENKEQVNRYLQSLMKTYLADIAEDRNIPAAKLEQISSQLLIRHVSDAKKLGMVDAIGYKDEAEKILHDLIGVDDTDEGDSEEDEEDDKKVNEIKLEKYASGLPEFEKYSKDRIAVVYAEGTIQTGGEDGMPSQKIIESLQKIREDENIKAVVLRINSPGGSALESDLMYRELQLTAKEKPLVVSMGNVAASGGYFIACPANYIYASPNSITGSIGVFALIPNAEKLFNDKLGIHFDGVATGNYSGLGSINRAVTPEEAVIFQGIVDSTYEDFLLKVARSRKMDREKVHAIAQGRVWTGADALEIGLVDAMGGLESAIKKAAEMAELEEYAKVEYPKAKNFLEAFFGGKIQEERERILREEMGPAYMVIRSYKEAMKVQGVQMRMPYEFHIH